MRISPNPAMQPVLFSLVYEVGSHDPNFLSLSGL